MKDIIQLLSLSMSGMDRERLRLEMAAGRLANANTAAPGAIKNGTAASTTRPNGIDSVLQTFESQLAGNPVPNIPQDTGGIQSTASLMQGTPASALSATAPLSSAAAGSGNHTSINPVEEMIGIMTAVRVYEANVRAFNATRGIALKALELGSPR